MLEQAIVAARFFQFASTLVLFGTPLFFLYGSKAVAFASPRAVLWAALLAALAATFAWVMAQTALLTGETRAAFDPGALWSVLRETSFGRVYLFRMIVLVFCGVSILLIPPSRRLWIVLSVLGATIVASFAWAGHGVRDPGLAGAVHLGADVAHLLAAGVWMGALAGLSGTILHAIRTRSQEDARATSEALERFSGFGSGVVAALILTGLVNSWFLIGPAHWRDLFLSSYGLVLLAKLALFAGMLACAGANRYLLAPRLRAVLGQGHAGPALRGLRASLLGETALALLVLGAVALLGTLNPPIAGE